MCLSVCLSVCHLPPVCVLQLQQDEVGYGFVLRGAGPCYVHTIDPLGPAAAAGLKVSRIIMTMMTTTTIMMTVHGGGGGDDNGGGGGDDGDDDDDNDDCRW